MPSRKELEETLRQLQGSQELVEDMIKPMAKLLHAKYEALIDTGFTKEQAFTIILHKGMEW